MCTEDKAIVKAGQEAMIQYSGQHWIVKELQGSHMAPFLLKQHETAEMVANFIESFEQAEGAVSSAKQG